WSCGSLGTNLPLYSITFGNNVFVALGQGAIAVSTDGFSWFVELTNDYQAYNGLSYGGGVFVRAGGGNIASSVDGLYWTNRFYPGRFFYFDPADVTAGNGTFVVVGPNGAILQSDPVDSAGFGPPQILEQPQSRTATVGDTVALGVGVDGAPPFSYQWQKN